MGVLKTVYISIGNSDDKLTQVEWAAFQMLAMSTVGIAAEQVHGRWYSSPSAKFQNACICAEIDEENVEYLRESLADLAYRYRQDSIAWAEVPVTEFIVPRSPRDPDSGAE